MPNFKGATNYNHPAIEDHLSAARAGDLGINRDDDFLAVAGYVGDAHRAAGSPPLTAPLRSLLVEAWIALEEGEYVRALAKADAAWALLPDASLRDAVLRPAPGPHESM